MPYGRSGKNFTGKARTITGRKNYGTGRANPRRVNRTRNMRTGTSRNTCPPGTHRMPNGTCMQGTSHGRGRNGRYNNGRQVTTGIEHVVRRNSPYISIPPDGGNNLMWVITCCGNSPVSGTDSGEGSLYHTTMVNCSNQCGTAVVEV